jgi:UDP-N-acetylmuramyl pentapeptide phosphotransferase/UDP-N-acetylglucosamine-1-phosphate transferase
MERDERRTLSHERKLTNAHHHFFVESGEGASEYLTQVVHYLHNFVCVFVFMCFFKLPPCQR